MLEERRLAPFGGAGIVATTDDPPFGGFFVMNSIVEGLSCPPVTRYRFPPPSVVGVSSVSVVSPAFALSSVSSKR